MIQQLNTFDRIFNFLIIIVLGIALTLIFSSNPSLLKDQALADTSLTEASHEKIFALAPGERSIEQTAPEKEFSTRQFNRKFLRVQLLDRTLPTESFGKWDVIANQLWATHKDSRTLSKYNFYFEELFSLRLPENQKILDFKVSEDMLLVGSETGQIYLIDLLSNKMIWTHKLLKNSVKQVFFIKDSAIAFTQNTEGTVNLNHIKLENGEITKTQSLPFNVKTFFNIAEDNAVLVANENAIAKINYEGSVIWKYEHTSANTGVLYRNLSLVLFGDVENKIIALDYTTGEMSWDYKLKGKMVATPTWIPKHNDIAILTDNNYLHLIEFNGKGKWYFNTHNESQSQYLSTFRLNNKLIEELNLKWVHEGWIVLSPCAAERLCVFNPENGAILSRIHVKSNFKEKPIFNPKQDSYFVMVLDPNGPKNLYEGEDEVTKTPWGIAEMMEVELFKDRFKEYTDQKKAQIDAEKAAEEAKKAQETSTQPTDSAPESENKDAV